MNYAIIFAGGVGKRMQNGALPKQFLKLNDKPIIIYTLEEFEKNNSIDGIVVICVSGWEDYMRDIIKKFEIKKVIKVLTGAATAIESQFVGINYITSELSTDDKNTYVLIHDGVRPLVDQQTIDRNVQCAHENGSAITVVPAIETIAVKNENNSIKHLIDRDQCMMARAPQSYRLSELNKVYESVDANEISKFIDSATMMMHYNYKLFTVQGSTKNIKVTTPIDFYIFKAILNARDNEQVFGG